jgi:hypothetical protein
VYGNESQSAVWTVRHGPDPETGEIVHTINLNRRTLRVLKPILADAANNLVHALDQVTSAAYRLDHAGRTRETYYPILADGAKYEQKLKRLRKLLGDEWVDLFEKFRISRKHEWPHVLALREVSDTSKHWELAAPGAEIAAIGWTPKGERQKIVDTPPNHFVTHDTFEFLRAAKPLGLPVSIVIALRLNGLAVDFKADPETILDVGARYVEGVIREAETYVGIRHRHR